MPRGILVMAGFAFREALRKKALLLAVLLTVAFLALFGYGVGQIMGLRGYPGGRDFGLAMATQLFTMGLYLASMITTLLAAFSGVAAISGELESGTAQGLISRPLPRSYILLGKFLGYFLMIAAYAALFFIGLWAVMRWQGGIAPPHFWEPMLLFILQPVVMLGVTFLGSTILSTLGNGITMFMLYGMAMVGGFLEQIGAMQANLGQVFGTTGVTGSNLVALGTISSLILPVDAIYRRAAFLLQKQSGDLWNGLQSMGPFGSVSVPSTWMVVYAVLYLVFCLWLAVRVFRRKEL